MKQTDEPKLYLALQGKFGKALISCRVNLTYMDFDDMWKIIMDKYSGRVYHNLDHVKDCIDRIEGLKNIYFDDLSKGTMVIALIFHDIEQEEPNPIGDSIYLFEKLLGNYMEPDVYSEIRNCILATDHFNDKSFQPTIEAYIVKDSDLAILGSAPPDYAIYRAQIMMEAKAAGLSEDIYYSERRKFLAGMLAQPKIYQTYDFGSIYEWTARNNLRRELKLINDNENLTEEF